VDGRELTQSFAVEADPRIATSRADLQRQFDFLLEVLNALTTTNELLNEIHALEEQLRPWEGRAGSESLQDQLSGMRSELDSISGLLIDLNISQSQLWPSGLHEKLNALFNSVDSADYAPPRQAREVFAKLRSELDHLEGRYEGVLGDQLRAFNRAVEDAGLPSVGTPGS
ncbi:MAG: hypothetical protein WBW04_00870, partial [Nitrolancea sp.]